MRAENQGPAVSGNRNGLAQNDDPSKHPGFHMGQTGNQAEHIVGRNRRDDGDGEEHVELLLVLGVGHVLFKDLFRHDMENEGLAITARQEEVDEGADADANVVIEKALPGAEQEHPGRGTDAAGNDGDDDLNDLNGDKNQWPNKTSAVEVILEIAEVFEDPDAIPVDRHGNDCQQTQQSGNVDQPA